MGSQSPSPTPRRSAASAPRGVAYAMPNRQSDMIIDERTIQNRRRYFEFEASEMAPISGWVMRPGGKGVRGHQRAFIGQKGKMEGTHR